uniref:Dynein heavy chain tail domain-containing protein n=1 Tax=Ciona savignyi TaxID=51511 RepID=H2ZL67_CIOSA
MALDDPRIEWIRDRVCLGLNIKDNEVFTEMLSRFEGEEEVKLQHFFNDSSDEEGTSALLFYSLTVEEMEEVEQCVYFLRNISGVIPVPNDIEEANATLSTYVETGLLNAHSLVMLEQMIAQVFIPLLSFGQHKSGEILNSAAPTPQLEQNNTNTPNGETPSAYSNLMYFLILGEIRLDIPNLNLEGDMIELTRRPGLMEDIETACGNWQQQISAAIEQQLKKKPQGNGPLAEIDFWRERNAALSALSEQLKLPTVTRMLDVLAQKADTTALSNFKMSRDELAKYYTEAKDNVRFLTTLERHFKVDPFELKSATIWKTVMTWFEREVQAIEAKYLSVARQMKDYEDNKYQQWIEYVDGALPGIQYVVNFAPELQEITTETKYMEQLGFMDYITRCDVAIGKFESLVNQIQKNSKDIDSRIQMIRNAELFKRIPPKPSGDLPSIETILSTPEIVLHPAVNEVHKLTVQCVRDCVESTKHFVRWMAGTCIETPAQQADGQDEPMLITFFQDIMHNPRIAELFSSISSNMQKILSNLSKFLGQQKWKRYRTLWKLEKTIVMEKFAAKNPSCVAYDDKLLFYSKIAEDVFLQATPKNQMGKDLERSPDSLEDLKFVLGVISNTKTISLDVEMRIRDIIERYRTIGMYKIEFSDEERNLITQEQITEFKTELETFADTFHESGPGAVGSDLEHGLKILNQFRKDLQKYEADRQELTNAEKLFDLPITSYPNLVRVQNEMRGLELIYALYEEQSVAREE